VKIRALSLLLAALLLPLLGVLAWEFHWRLRHELLKPQAPSPDATFVAETRSLPPARPGTAPSGVFLRGRWGWLRSLQPQLVFAGECDEVSTRWFTARRLVIECELRSGEPRLLREFVGGVVIELVVQRRFADDDHRGSALARAHPDLRTADPRRRSG
jgi:hypothetical protein